MTQTPLEQFGVPGRQQESWSGKGWRSADQSLELFICQADRMAEVPNACGTAGSPATMLYTGSYSPQ